MDFIDIVRFVAPVALGGIIGAFTNYIAIKMMFRPYSEKRLLGFVVPFTPGIIPKRQNDLAKAIGRVVSDNLVDADGISKMLLSDETIGKLESKIDEMIHSLQTNENSLRVFFSNYAGEERVENLIKRVNDNLVSKIDGIVSDEKIGQTIAASAMSALDERIGDGFMGMITKNALADTIKDKITPKLANLINDVMRGDGRKMILSIVDDEINRFANGSVASWAAGMSDEKIESLKRDVVNLYSEKVKTELPRLLRTIDISKIVEDKIQSMDMPTVERLLLDVANNELYMLVWLGGLLGAIIGVANIFFMI
ncbi:MAG: DUF445 family protein [Paludibacteraceae bacterium]|jgi:uncharacterized membrane protein YheB (UPF0754 family)|nr:DUF445 family protein [Paludibacteraceae bacterium]